MPIMPMISLNTLKDLHAVFDPTKPLKSGDKAYVDCRAVRGENDILQETGKRIEWATEPTCQLYSGHRGTGKSTELLRLTHYLEEQGYLVVYFDAGEDIDPEDARYTDILLACTKHFLKKLKDDKSPITDWLANRWNTLKGIMTASVEFVPELTLEGFSTLTEKLRLDPDIRHKVRELVDPHTPSLIDALNQHIQNSPLSSKLVIIADSLDRIVPIVLDPRTKRTNHDEIFVERSGQLKALKCHLIYTVPISVVYFGTANELADRYGLLEVLPMITVRQRGETRRPHEAGINLLKTLITQRVNTIFPELSLTDLFATPELVTDLCLMSGGNMRALMLLIRTTFERATTVPIPPRAVQQAIARMRETYQTMILESQWELLAQVYLKQFLPNDDDHRRLLFDRCVLEYRQVDEAENIIRWHDVHPLIEGIERFQQAVQRVKETGGR